MRRGQDIDLNARAHGRFMLSDLFAGFASDAGAFAAGAFDVFGGGGAGSAAYMAGRSLVSMARSSRVLRRQLQAHPTLEHLLMDCERLPGSDEHNARVAARVAFMLTRELDARDPTPLVVVFADHLEKLQVEGRRPGETTLNLLVSRLPLCLFVMTGRNVLRWAEEDQTHLDVKGRATWPGLVTESPVPEGPRQHQVGNLSAPDSVDLLERTFALLGVHVAEGVPEALAKVSGGWALHLDTIADVARGRTDLDRPLTLADLGGPLPAVVDRLFDDLVPDQQRALLGACLLPYFDAPLVAHTVGVDVAAVLQLCQRSIVQRTTNAHYPFRVHDEIRWIVRQAGATQSGGWAPEDWHNYGERALEEARKRYEAAMSQDGDRAAILSLALALNLGAENGVYAAWLRGAVRNSPTLKGLSPLVSSEPDVELAHPDIAAMIRYVRAMATKRGDERIEEFARISAGPTDIASTAGLWLAYDLRSAGRTDEAIAQLEALLIDPGDRVRLYALQIPVTYLVGRRYRSAFERLATLDDAGRSRVLSHAWSHHAVFDGRVAHLEDRLQKTVGRRYKIEVMGSWLVAKHHAEGVTAEEIARVGEPARETGHTSSLAQAIRVQAETSLFDDALVDRNLLALAELSESYHRPLRSYIHALAMRSLATGRAVYAAQAAEIARTFQPARDGGWISTEFLLEHLGYPLPPVETQWLDPPEVVRERWLAIFQRTVERARGRIEQGQ